MSKMWKLPHKALTLVDSLRPLWFVLLFSRPRCSSSFPSRAAQVAHVEISLYRVQEAPGVNPSSGLHFFEANLIKPLLFAAEGK